MRTYTPPQQVTVEVSPKTFIWRKGRSWKAGERLRVTRWGRRTHGAPGDGADR